MRRKWLLSVVGWSYSPTGIAIWSFALRETNKPKLNLILITLDTTRADHLGCYGHETAFTPTLDGLAQRGVLFERTYAPAPFTLPAHASIHTGVYPFKHGLFNNGMSSLNVDFPTLAQTLVRAAICHWGLRRILCAG